jgi:hypothetical protein
VITFPDPLEPGESAEGTVSFTAPTTDEELDLQVALVGRDGKVTGFVFGIPQAAGTPTPSPTPAA